MFQHRRELTLLRIVLEPFFLTERLVLVVEVTLFHQIERAFSATNDFPATNHLWMLKVVHFLIALVQLRLIAVHKLPLLVPVRVLQVLYRLDILVPIAQEAFLAVLVQKSQAVGLLRHILRLHLVKRRDGKRRRHFSNWFYFSLI